MFEFIYELSPAAVAAYYAAISVISVLIFLFVIKKVFSVSAISEADEGVVTTTLTGMFTLGCIIIGFSLASALANRDKADQDMMTEALSIENLAGSLQREGSAQSLVALKNLVAYTSSIVQDEMPLMAKNKLNPKTTELFFLIDRNIDRIELKTIRESQIYAQILKGVDAVRQARYSRLLNAQVSLPPLFIIANNFCLLLISLLSACLILIHFSRTRLIVVLIQNLIWMFFAAILMIDRPISGISPISIDPLEAVERVLRR